MAEPWLIAALVFGGSFVLSGVLPAYFRAKGRSFRARRFATRYRAWVEADNPSRDDRDWLIARGAEMQADAAKVGQGVVHIAPPPAAGGGPFRPQYIFSDLAGMTTFGVETSERLDALTQTQYQLGVQARYRFRDLLLPWRWIQLAFERLISFPRYLLKVAGFSDAVSGSTAARGVGVVWSLIVGLATIGAFVLSLLDYT
jgi:hypothetical protein